MQCANVFVTSISYLFVSLTLQISSRYLYDGHSSAQNSTLEPVRLSVPGLERPGTIPAQYNLSNGSRLRTRLFRAANKRALNRYPFSCQDQHGPVVLIL